MKIQVGDVLILMVGTIKDPNVKQGEWQVVYEDKLIEEGDPWRFAMLEILDPVAGLLWTDDEGVFTDDLDPLRCRPLQITRNGEVVYKEE